MMINLRSACWPADREALSKLDTSFTTDRVYRVVATAGSFALEEQLITPPLHKAYELGDELDTIEEYDYVAVAEIDGAVVGLAALKNEAWNRRAVLWHIYVAHDQRGHGIGRALIEHVSEVARTWQARCLWLETQNVNYPAIQAYRGMGFQLCGLDLSLYDPASTPADEVALFFVRAI